MDENEEKSVVDYLDLTNFDLTGQFSRYHLWNIFCPELSIFNSERKRWKWLCWTTFYKIYWINKILFYLFSTLKSYFSKVFTYWERICLIFEFMCRKQDCQVKNIILIMSILLSLFRALENYEKVKPCSSLSSPFQTL